MTLSLVANGVAILVGTIFLLSGVAKILEPWKFAQHLEKLGLLKPQLILPIALTFTGIECALGVALILGVAPKAIAPIAILILLGLSILTYWSTSTGRTQDCGCYNGWLEITPTQSLVLNAIYIILLIFAEFLGSYEPTLLWQWMVVGVILFAGVGLAGGSMEYFRDRGRPFIDFAPLQINRIWQPEWLGEDADSALMSGEKIVVFLSPQCLQCKSWLNPLKIVHWRDDLPNVAGVIELTTLEEVREFVNSNFLNFPAIAMPGSQLNKLGINAFPTALFLEDGVIKDKWVGLMPLWFIEKIREQVTFEVNQELHDFPN